MKRKRKNARPRITRQGYRKGLEAFLPASQGGRGLTIEEYGRRLFPAVWAAEDARRPKAVRG